MKTKNPFFLEIYNKAWSREYSRWDHTAWACAFTGSRLGKLPASTQTQAATLVSWDGKTVVTVILNPSGHGSKHRAHVFCDRCNKLVPAGRIHQHKC